MYCSFERLVSNLLLFEVEQSSDYSSNALESWIKSVDYYGIVTGVAAALPESVRWPMGPHRRSQSWQTHIAAHGAKDGCRLVEIGAHSRLWGCIGVGHAGTLSHWGQEDIDIRAPKANY